MEVSSSEHYDETEVSSMLYLSDTYRELSSRWVSQDSYRLVDEEPFPRSSLIVEEPLRYGEQEPRLSLYMVTKNLTFLQFDISGYLSGGVITQVQEVSLNKSHVNSLCRDLTQVKILNQLPPTEGFLLFCKGYMVIEGPHEPNRPRPVVAMYTVIFVMKGEGGVLDPRQHVFYE